jgi:hypothetical protein
MLWPLLCRFKREEIKIHAWEDHQKAKIEAEMRKIEVSYFLPSNISHLMHIFSSEFWPTYCNMPFYHEIPMFMTRNNPILEVCSAEHCYYLLDFA